MPDTAAWAASVADWVSPDAALPVVVGELGDLALALALVESGATVDAVDPRGAVVWAAHAAAAASGDRLTVTLAEIVDHLRSLPTDSRSATVVSGCVDRASLVGNVELVDEAARVVVPGGTLVLLVTDQAAWGAALDPVTVDLLPGRPLHPETWRVVLTRRGVAGAVWRSAGSGTVHTVVAEVDR